MPITEVASFSVSYLQVLDEEGHLDEALDPQLSEDQLVRLYRSMMLAREADGRMLKMQRQGRLGTFPPCTGQEAAVCGAALAMSDHDWLVAAYRELGARLMRGEPLDATLQYYNGYEEGSRQCMENRILPTQVILGSQVPHAVGLAYAARYRGEKETAVVAFFGDGASSQGDVHEAMNFAGVWRVPVVLVCQNNGWAISVPRSTQTRAETIAQRAHGYGFAGLQVDGNDALAVYRATSEALARARAGEGPTLIEAITYRLMMHTTADDPKKYRSEEEEQAWWKRDPIPRLRVYMERRGIWNEDREQGLAAQVKKEVDDAVRRLEAADPRAFKPDVPFDHVLGTRHDELERQRAAFLADMQSRAAREGSDG